MPAIISSPGMLQLIDLVERIAQTNAAVLITGESGSGKELIARAVHHYSLRCSKPWVDVSCAALPEHLVESELFGYEEGAFSGADSPKPGLFELANHGTLFLDEVGELEPRMQVKLLQGSGWRGVLPVGRDSKSDRGRSNCRRHQSGSGEDGRNRAASAAICIIVWARFACACLRCASVAKTLCRWPSISSINRT